MAKKSYYGVGDSKTVTGKGGVKKANVTAEQLKASGYKTLTGYMNAWNRNGTRPTAGSAPASKSSSKTASKTVTKAQPSKPASKPKSIAEKTAAALRKESNKAVGAKSRELSKKHGPSPKGRINAPKSGQGSPRAEATAAAIRKEVAAKKSKPSAPAKRTMGTRRSRRGR